MVTTSKILAEAATLSSVELSNLVLKLQALQSLSSAITTKKTGETGQQEIHVQVLYHALSSQLQAQLRVRPIPVTKFFTTTGLSLQVKESLVLAAEQLDALAPNMTRVEWNSIADLVAGLAVNRVRQNGFKVPWFGISLTLKNLPSLLDEHFPGYASSNLLKLVLQLRTQKKERSHVWDQPVKKTGAG